MLRFLTFAFLVLHCGLAVSTEEKAEHSFQIPALIEDLLMFYCHDCHDSGMQKGDVQLDDLGALNQGERLDLLNIALEHTYSGEMPPRKGDQPKEAEREALVQWMWQELKAFDAAKLDDKLRHYKYANYLDHDKLFHGDTEEISYTRARRWRVNELIYHERINDVFELKGKDRRDSFLGIVRPFNLPTSPGVAYYDTEVIEGGQLITLLSNAKWVVEKQLRPARVESGEHQFSKEYLEAKGQRNFYKLFPDERWNLRQTAEPFARIIFHDGIPSEAMFREAIIHQFKVALQREPNDAEMGYYLKLALDTLEKSNKTDALRNVMTSVLMEPEFLYRPEFGGGEPDADGRVKLTPREASYAIAYALTDRIPDPELVAAMESGKLMNAEDYDREIRRILNDPNIKKPRILRFFQDYFGYNGVYDVFKDEERFIGAYNPHRVVSTKYVYRVPGKVAKEADTLVEWILEKDKNVLETLLTTDRFFVHHNGNNDEMKSKAVEATDKAAENRAMYKGAKDLDREGVVEYLKSINQYVSKEGKVARRFYIEMNDWEMRFGPDGTIGEGENLTAMPRDPEGVAHSVKMWNLDYLTWDYEPEQPMQLENRTGILSHPAWLIANSLNAATDPIHRGKWIREKLLGGFIRDVPITVDAKVPEDPARTLRERFVVSEAKECWQCHEKMNPLGYVFEQYDDFGRFRSKEPIEYPENILETKKVSARGEHGVFKTYDQHVYRTKPVDSSGFLEGTGNPALDGPVDDVDDLMSRLAKSERVRQVFIRNVFRYFMGRNETLADSATLRNADRTYLESGGSFTELMVSILTSDSFIYRK